jgi:hypothetical protein
VSCDPKLDEFVRANELRPQWFRGFQHHIRMVVIPHLEERERLLMEVTALRADLQGMIEKDARRPRKDTKATAGLVGSPA